MKQKVQGSLLLLLGTFIWGTAFVAQSVGMDHIGPFTFQAVRSALAVLAMLCAMGLMDRKRFRSNWQQKGLWKAGILCGMALFVASGLQQVGLVYTDAGKAGFITAMYIVLVPVIGLFLKQRVSVRVWVSVALAVAGLYLLSCMGASGINFGDLCLMGCAVAFAVQITLVDKLAGALDGLRLNCVQFLVNACLSAVMMLLLEKPVLSDILQCAWPLVYTGVMSSAVAYYLQILGQQRLDSAPASLIMSLEAVFAALSGWLVLHERLSPAELLGCALVFIGVVLSQLPEQKKA